MAQICKRKSDGTLRVGGGARPIQGLKRDFFEDILVLKCNRKTMKNVSRGAAL